MGNMRACIAVALLALAACGSDHSKVDASIIIPDTAVDAKVWMDAPPSMYDLTCFGGTAPTTAADPITIAGSTQTLTQQGPEAVGMVLVEVFKTGTVNPVATVTSDAAGAFITGNIATGGTPLDGFLRGAKATFRTSYLYPPSPATASLAGVPLLVVSNQAFTLLSTQLAMVTQDDTNNGALVVAVTDCSTPPTPIDGATLKVQQSGTDVGTIFDLGAIAAQAAGTFFVFNVPDGPTQLLVSFDGKDFPVRTVVAHKKPNGMNAEGTMTVTAVRPGP